MSSFHILIYVGIFLIQINATDAQLGNDPSEASQDKSASKQPAETPACTQAIELGKAMYGIPIGASSDEIRKWLDEKKVKNYGSTKSDLERICKRELTVMNGLGLLQDMGIGGEEIKGGKNIDYAQLERQLPKVSFNAAKVGVDARPYVEALHLICVTLKNPTFSYQGTTCFLESVMPGLNDAFALGVAPSEEMKRDGIGWIRVFLWKKGDVLVSYGAAVGLRQNADKVINTLNEKYGESQLLTIKQPQAQCNELYRLTGFHSLQLGRYEIRQWRKNIVMTQPQDSHTAPAIIYYDADVAKEILHAQDVALRELEEKIKREVQERDQQQSDRMKDNF